ncbi:hypothetical protein HU200_027600 [Digitaria exilis]|uniref:KIB1-4 beta-propeller domain-containing protein n=1 Tax=Digitaria exilis TaxID=1010633 RepID=A0A835EUS0_9POAL|nr:hypothetical protein HU200_027600 [Digitaria exilis]
MDPDARKRREFGPPAALAVNRASSATSRGVRCLLLGSSSPTRSRRSPHANGDGPGWTVSRTKRGPEGLGRKIPTLIRRTERGSAVKFRPRSGGEEMNHKNPHPEGDRGPPPLAPPNPSDPNPPPPPAPAMAPFRRWADLPPDLLSRIGDCLDLKWYASARGACTAWRCALAPPSPALLVFADDARWCPRAASLPTRRSFELAAIVSGSRCVGSSNGWLALSVALFTGQTVFVLLNPIAAVEIVLPPLIYESRWVSKVVFTPTPAKDDFAAAAICDIDRIAYVTAGARRWAVLDPVRLTSGDQLTDVVYTDKGKVYCLTKCGDVHLLRLPERHRRKPANADEAAPSEPKFSVLQPPAERAINLRPLRWQQQRTFRMMRFEQARRDQELTPLRLLLEPLLSEANLPFNPATVFAPPYDTVSAFTSAKNLVFCEGNLYQVWRNASCTRRVAENEILVLRYYPRRQPCWDVVKDLGEGVPGLRGNCVYWIGGRGRDQGMIFDMESGSLDFYLGILIAQSAATAAVVLATALAVAAAAMEEERSIRPEQEPGQILHKTWKNDASPD